MTGGRFVVVGTPIGNLGDISPRAADALRAATVAYCEDTRRTRKLFSALAIPTPRLVRLDQHNESAMTGHVLAAIDAGESAVLVTDAGMPTISDPGSRIVAAVASAGHVPEVVPGPTAVGTALALSGLPASQYRFAGFLPRKGRERTDLLEELAGSRVTVVFYEAPNRVVGTVADLAERFGSDRAFAAARELTKLHEEVWRGSLGEANEWLVGVEPRGEWVLLVGPAVERSGAAAATLFSDEAISAVLRERLASGVDRRSAVAAVAAELGVAKRRVYAVALELKGGSAPKDAGESGPAP